MPTTIDDLPCMFMSIPMVCRLTGETEDQVLSKAKDGTYPVAEICSGDLNGQYVVSAFEFTWDYSLDEILMTQTEDPEGCKAIIDAMCGNDLPDIAELG